MSQIDVFSYASPAQGPARQHVQRLGRVGVVAPAMRAIYEDTVGSNDFDTFGPLGIGPPDNAPVAAVGAAGVLTGDYAYYAVPYDSGRGVEGQASAVSNVVSPSNQLIDVDLTPITNAGDFDRWTHTRLYRNLNGGTVFFFVAEVTVATTAYQDNNSDASIQANDTLQLDNTAPLPFTYGIARAHKSYMFLAGPWNAVGGTDYDDKFIWSKLANPDAYPTVNETLIEPGMFGVIRAVESIGDTLAFFKDHAIYELRFETNPSGVTGDGTGKTVNTQRGCINSRCAANDQGTLYVMDRAGIYAFRGGTQVIEMGKPLKKLWDRINWEQREKFCAAVGEDAVYFAVALDADEECHWMFALDLNAVKTERGVRWYVHRHDFGIRDMTSGVVQAPEFGEPWTRGVLILTEFGQTGMLGMGYRDLVDPQLTARGTVVAATTTTITDNGAGVVFDRTNEAGDFVDLVGSYLRFLVEPDANKPGSLDWSQAYRITDQAGQTLTVSPAMPSAPPAGTEYVIGAIPDARIHSPQMAFGRPLSGKKIGRVGVEYQPTATPSVCGVGVKSDRRGIEGIAQDASESEFVSVSGDTFKRVNMGGTAEDGGRVGSANGAVSARGARYLQLVLDGTGVDNPIIVDSTQIEVLDMEDAQ